ncbi:helix-turn-helix domain-containing protein [Peribacillus kribbensis]|uniref:helix-turn-helix domain-containing protein n=1 Tax=Peribacillus kribbensis TaxID=356658 RepID=UPI00047A17E8|nr:helix-turn-helix transcriptional regulator [Peribacillus kribbensis]
MHIGQVIRQKRQAQFMSSRQLADLLGIDPSLLSRYETGKRNISRTHVIGIKSYLSGDYDHQIYSAIMDDLRKTYENLTGRKGLELWNVQSDLITSS